ncbi:MAG: extracellular solute-binding protein [Bermanella sp.]
MQRFIGFMFALLITASPTFVQSEELKILTWEGYVEEEDVSEVNKILADLGYDYQVKVITPWAQGPRQMYTLLRDKKADISFLTLNYINQKNGQIANLLQAINADSPRLSNYKKLLPQFKDIDMGKADGATLYIPWGGGAYGIWANMNKLENTQLPKSVSELWHDNWKGKISLSIGQIEPNVALASLALKKDAFYLNDTTIKRKNLYAMTAENSDIQQKLNALYGQVGEFWKSSPAFDQGKLLVASYGFGAAEANRNGGNWKLVKFREGNTVWLDTINFHKDLTGKKLEAAEIFANYFIDNKVQERIANNLGMVSVSTTIDNNPLLLDNPDFFKKNMFWPPYNKSVSMVLRKLSRNAMRAAKGNTTKRHLEKII